MLLGAINPSFNDDSKISAIVKSPPVHIAGVRGHFEASTEVERSAEVTSDNHGKSEGLDSSLEGLLDRP